MATLFSGAGGLDSGFAQSGKFKMLLANDVLYSPAETYSKNFNHRIVEVSEFSSKSKLPVYVVGDISKIDFSPLGKLDCIVGGPPCQDFSITRGKSERRGIEVTRGKLYSHFIRSLIRTQPKVFVFENVPGLISANKGNAYKIIKEDFLKMHVRWSEIKDGINSIANDAKNYSLIFSDIVDASKVGVPQRRKRLIIIGVKEDKVRWPLDNELRQRAETILHGKKNLLSRYPLTTLEVFEGKTIPELATDYEEIMKEYEDVAKKVKTPVAQRWYKNVWKLLTFDIISDYLSANDIKPKSKEEITNAFKEHEEILQKLGYGGNPLEGKYFKDESNELPNEGEGVVERMKMIPPDMNSTFVNGTKWKVESRGMSHIYRRLHPLKPAYTVLAYGGGGTWSYHYRRSRARLTNRERARLQTFPDSYMFEGGVSEVRAQIGEAVPVLLGKKLANIVETVLEKI